MKYFNISPSTFINSHMQYKLWILWNERKNLGNIKKHMYIYGPVWVDLFISDSYLQTLLSERIISSVQIKQIGEIKKIASQRTY